MRFTTRQLQRSELGAYAGHLLALGAEDRRLRFGQAVDDRFVRGYVERIDARRDAVFGVSDAELTLIGAAHVARGRRTAELGISVLGNHRGRGIGGALLRRALLHARNWGAPRFVAHSLRVNAPLVRLARRHGLRIVADHAEVDGILALPAPDPASLATELFVERIGRLDHLLKQQSFAFRRIASAWLG